MIVFHGGYVPDYPNEPGPWCFDPIHHPEMFLEVMSVVDEVMEGNFNGPDSRKSID
jgi:hypothetical protein